MTTFRLTATALDARQLEDGVRAAWVEALADPRAGALLEREGVKDTDALARAKIAVDMTGGDIAADWVGDALVKIGVTVASGAVLKLFDEFVMPKLKERFGADVVGETIIEHHRTRGWRMTFVGDRATSTGSANVQMRRRPGLAMGVSALALIVGAGAMLAASPASAQYLISNGDTEVVDGSGDGTTGTLDSPWTVPGTGSLVVGDNAFGNNDDGILIIRGGGQVDSSTAAIGRLDNGIGKVTVTGDSTWINIHNMEVGDSNLGTLMISDGGTVESGIVRLGFFQAAHGTITVDGADSELTASGSASLPTGYLDIGYWGHGTLEVSNGAAVRSEIGRLGVFSLGGTPSLGEVTITSGSTWTNTQAIEVGSSGHGTLTISGGGTVESETGIIGRFDGSNGSVTIAGPNSRWINEEIIRVGQQGRAELRIENGGYVRSGTGVIGPISGYGEHGEVIVTGTGSLWEITTGFSDPGLSIGYNGQGALTLTDGGKVTVNQVILGEATHFGLDRGIGTLNIGSAAGDTAAAAGILEAPGGLIFGNDTGTLVFNHTDGDYIFGLDVARSGPGDHGTTTIRHQNGTTTYTGDGSAFTGTTNITGGRLNVTDSLGGSMYVGPGTLGGTGEVGDVNVSNGGAISPGVGDIGTLTLNNLTLAGSAQLHFDLGTPGASDLIVVNNDLTLNGALHVTDAGGFGNGEYTLIQYGNLVADNTLAIGSMPDPDLTYIVASGTVGTGPGEVILTVSGGAAGTNQYWDGSGPFGNGVVNGGTGVWNTANTNWTDQDGNATERWGGDFAIFGGSAGTVTVEGSQAFTGMQFLTGGYTIDASAGGELVANLANTNIRIASGTATISAPITGTGGLVKQEGGTLVLVGDNAYAGDTRIMDGVLRVEGGAALGQGEVSVDGAGGLLDVAAGGVVDGLNITVNAGGAGLGARLGNGSSAAGSTLVANGGGINILAGADITGANLEAYGSSEIWVYFDTTGAQTHTVASLGGDGGVHLLGDGGDVLAISSGTASTFAGVISGDAGLTKTGVGALTLTGDNTYTGLTTLQGGAWLYLGDGGEGGSIAGDVQIDSGALYFNRSDDFTFAGQITGTNSAHLRQNGDGTTTLTGDNSGFNGNSVIVSAGRLVIADGSTLGMGGAGIINVQSGGALGGRGTIVTPTLNVNGRLTPGEDMLGTLNVTGDVNFGPESVFVARIASNGDNDALDLTGQASLAGNVEVAAIDPHVSYVDGQTYTILTATDPLVGTFADATMLNHSAFLTPTLTHNADNVVLTIGVTADFTTVAQTFNQLQASSALNGLGQTGDALTVFNEIAMLGPDQARRAFDLTSGEIHASGQHVIDQTFGLFNRTLRQQGTAGIGGFGGTGVITAPLGYAAPSRAAAGVGAIDDATATHAPSRVANAWLTPLGGRGTIDGDGNAATLDWWNAGLAGGYEGQIDLGAGTGFAGIGLGYIRSHGSVDARLSSVDADGFHIGVYGAWEDGAWRLAGSLAYAANRISTERNIMFGGLNRTAEADYWTHSIGFSGEAAYGMDMGGGTTLLPLFTLDAGWSGHDGFTERGADALNLTAGAESWTRLDTGLGIGISHVVPTETGRLVLEGRAVWEHAFADLAPSHSLSFAGSPTGFDVRGPAASRDRLRIGAGLARDVAPDMTIRANYDGLFSGDQSSHTGSIGLNIRF